MRPVLERPDPRDVVEFQNQFDAHFDEASTWGLWVAAYLIHGGCSDDGFIDFRYALISDDHAIFE